MTQVDILKVHNILDQIELNLPILLEFGATAKHASIQLTIDSLRFFLDRKNKRQVSLELTNLQQLVNAH